MTRRLLRVFPVQTCHPGENTYLFPGFPGQYHDAHMCVHTCTAADVYHRPVTPVAYQVILEPGIGQFREFEPPRVHTRID